MSENNQTGGKVTQWKPIKQRDRVTLYLVAFTDYNLMQLSHSVSEACTPHLASLVHLLQQQATGSASVQDGGGGDWAAWYKTTSEHHKCMVATAAVAVE